MSQSHVPIRKRPAGGRSLKDFSIVERLCFTSGWHPLRPWESEQARVGRWADWASYLRDWGQVRNELVAHRGSAVRSDGSPLFADLVAAYAAIHGLAALDKASPFAIRGVPEPKAGETLEAYQRRIGDEDD